MKILASAPSRISFFGGSTDIPAFSDKWGGMVFSMAINLRTHVALYTDDDTFENPYHLFPANVDKGLAYTILKEYNHSGMHSGVTIESEFDGIIGAGLGSSGSFGVALVAALERRKKRLLDRNDIAEKAFAIEVNTFGKAGGRQDQFAAAYGGLNLFTFGKFTKVTPCPQAWIDTLYPYMILFYTGGQRESEKQQEAFQELDQRQINALKRMKELLTPALEALSNGNMQEFGDYLSMAWELKKASSDKVSNTRIDEIYDEAKKVGALGGKMLGSGGGGHLLFLIPPQKRKGLISAMSSFGLEEVDFSYDLQGVTTRII